MPLLLTPTASDPGICDRPERWNSDGGYANLSDQIAALIALTDSDPVITSNSNAGVECSGDG